MSAFSREVNRKLRAVFIEFLQCQDFNDVPMNAAKAEEYATYLENQNVAMDGTDSELAYQYARVMILKLKSTVRG